MDKLPPLADDKDAGELAKLVRSIKRAEGDFSLFFVECNSPVLRRQLAEQASNQLSIPPIILDACPLADSEPVQLDLWIAEQVEQQRNHRAAIFLFGLEHLLPTSNKEKLQQQVQQINWRRSSFSRLNRPLVIWLPTYAIQILAEHTPDFYDWYSGVFHFTLSASDRKAMIADFQSQRVLADGASSMYQMSLKEKNQWLHSLVELLHEHKADELSKAQLLSDIALTEHLLGNFDKALSNYQKSLSIYQGFNNQTAESTLLRNISQIHEVRGEIEVAIEVLLKSLAISQKISDRKGEGVALNNLAHLYEVTGDISNALNLLDKALIIRRETGDLSGEGVTLNNLAEIYIELGDYSAALQYFNKALSIQKGIADHWAVSATLNNIAQVYIQQGDYTSAFSYLNNALSIHRNLGNRFAEGTALNALSHLYHELGNYAEAFSHQKKSINIRKSINDIAGLGVSLFNFGQLHLEIGEVENGILHCLKAYSIAKQINGHRLLTALDALANHLGHEEGLQYWEQLANQPEVMHEE